MRQWLGIDLADPKLLDQTMTLIEARVSELDGLFAKQEGRSP